jgi:tryptophan synthase alpha subunit
LVEEVRGTTHTTTPLVVGFAISTPDQASTIVSAGADCVVVGSAFAKTITDGKDVPERIEELAREFEMGGTIGKNL